jgi:hypothetical protein
MIDLLLLRSLVDYGSGFVVFDSFLALRFLGAVVWPWWGAVAMAAGGARARATQSLDPEHRTWLCVPL